MRYNRRMAKRTKMTKKITDEIYERLAAGENITSICKDEHMPSRRTVGYWFIEEPEFFTKYKRSVEVGAEFWMGDTEEIARDQSIDPQRARIIADGRKFHIAKVAARFGDKQKVEHSGEVSSKVDLTGLTKEQLDAVAKLAESFEEK